MKHFTATAIVHNESGQVLMVHHKKLQRWMCPGGHIERDELPDEAVLREVFEETGLHVHIIPNHDHIDLVYRCMAKKDAGHLRVNKKETHDVRWFNLSEVEGWNETQTFPNVRSVIMRSAVLLK